MPEPTKCSEMFAFVVEDEKGNEGILGRVVGTTYMPFIGADMSRLMSLKELADELAIEGCFKYKILHFKLEGEIKEVDLNSFSKK